MHLGIRKWSSMGMIQYFRLRYSVPIAIIAVAGWLLSEGLGVPGVPILLPILKPIAVSVDQAGNLYFCDRQTHSVWRVNSHGRADRVAGSGSLGYRGDGVTAASASLSDPTGVACDRAGGLYIADRRNQCIRRVDAQGIISTVTGTRLRRRWRPRGIGVLSDPVGVVCDTDGSLFVAEAGNRCIRRVDTRGVITVVAGSGVNRAVPAKSRAAFARPSDLAFDATGNLYIADSWRRCVWKLSRSGAITIAAGNGVSAHRGDGGPAIKASINDPWGITFDGDGNLYIADLCCIRKVTRHGIITTMAGGDRQYGYSGDGGIATKARLNWPTDVAVDAGGNVYIVDSHNRCIRAVDKRGIITTIVASSRFTLQ